MSKSHNQFIRTQGLYYKTFYVHSVCRIVISQSVCHGLSLPQQSSICGQGLEPTIKGQSSDGLHSGRTQLQLQILDYGGRDRLANTLTYYNPATTTTIIGFIVQAPDGSTCVRRSCPVLISFRLFVLFIRRASLFLT